MHIEFCGILSCVQADVVHPPRQDTGSPMIRACLWDICAQEHSHSFPCFPDVGNMLARLLASAVLAGGPQGFQRSRHSRSSLYQCFISIISGCQIFLGNGVMAHANRAVSLLHSEPFPGNPTELACAPTGSRCFFHCWTVAHHAHTAEFTQHPPSEGPLLIGVELEPKPQQILGCRFSCGPDF